MLREIYLVRHGEVASEYRGRYLGHRTDPPLDPEGKKGLEPLRSLHCDVVFVSPSRRAVETAEFIPAPPCFDVRIREIDFGRWDNRTFAEIEPEATSDQMRLWAEASPEMVFPEGERVGDFFDRIDAFLADLLVRSEGSAAIVSHCWTIGRIYEVLTRIRGGRRIERGEVVSLRREPHDPLWKEFTP